jgi:hypothetical protein
MPPSPDKPGKKAPICAINGHANDVFARNSVEKKMVEKPSASPAPAYMTHRQQMLKLLEKRNTELAIWISEESEEGEIFQWFSDGDHKIPDNSDLANPDDVVRKREEEINNILSEMKEKKEQNEVNCDRAKLSEIKEREMNEQLGKDFDNLIDDLYVPGIRDIIMSYYSSPHETKQETYYIRDGSGIQHYDTVTIYSNQFDFINGSFKPGYSDTVKFSGDNTRMFEKTTTRELDNYDSHIRTMSHILPGSVLSDLFCFAVMIAMKDANILSNPYVIGDGLIFRNKRIINGLYNDMPEKTEEMTAMFNLFTESDKFPAGCEPNYVDKHPVFTDHAPAKGVDPSNDRWNEA